MTTMSLPNEFLGLNHSFRPENIPPLVVPSVRSNSNFASTPATNNLAQFCGSGFFSNAAGYDAASAASLSFMNSSQRPAHFNLPFIQQNKPAQPEVSSKDEISQLSTSVNRTTNSFNNDIAAQSAYWPRQTHLSPFGVLSHNISSDQVEEKSPYENVLNAHYIVQSLNNLNQLPMTDGDKKANQLKNKDSGMKKLPQSYVQQKSMNEMKPFQMQDEMSYSNGVINPGQVTKLDQSKLTNYKKMTNEIPVNETPVTAARDYRTFKSEASLFNATAPVVKYTGKASKQFAQKSAVKTNPNNVASTALPLMKNQRGVSCSPLMAQKMADFHREDSRSSPLSSDDNMGEQMRYSSPNSVKEQDTVYHNLNTMNNVCHATANLVTPIIPNYRDQHQDMNCHMNGNKNKVTYQFTKLPTNSAPNNGAITTDTSQMNRKTSFTSPYNPFNDQLTQAVPQKRSEKPPERVETQCHVQVANNLSKIAMHGDGNTMMLSKQSPNGSVGYSSVIMRTDRNYETDEKMEKSVRQQRQQPLLWPNNEPLKADKVNSYKAELPVQSQRNLLMGLTERQQSYFDNSTQCQPLVSQNMAQLKCNSSKNTLKSMYDGGQQHTMETAQQMPQNADQQQFNHYHQYLPIKLATSMNQPMPESTDLSEKTFSRKRRSPKTPEYQQNRDPPPAHVNMYPQQMQSTPYLMENAAANRYEVPNQYYSQNNMQSFNNSQAVPEQSHHQTSSMTSPAISRMSSGSPMRQMSQVAQTHTLSSYFATAQPNNQYSPSDYQVPSSSAYADPMQHYPSAEVPTYVPNVMNCEPPVDESRPKVIVPNVEDEFKFLFDQSLPHYKEIARPVEEEALYRNKSAIYRNNKIDFLTSYMNFLENNCESVESLSDSNTVAMKTWNRNKIAYQPVLCAESNKDEPKPKPAPAPPKEPVKLPPVTVTKEPECNFENDPRYYPLPKSSDKRRLDSSSEDEFDRSSKKSKTSDHDAAKRSSGEKLKKKVTFKKDIKTIRIFESGKKKTLKKETEEKVKQSTKVVKTKPERTEKVKPKNEKSTKKNSSGEKMKPKVEKPVAEVKAVKPPVVPPKKRSAKDSSKNTPIEIPRRKVSDRKAKDGVKNKIKGAMESDDELQSSSDSDPSWTPRDDDEENFKRRSFKMRSVRLRVKSSKKSSEQDFNDHFQHKSISKKTETKDSSSDSLKGSKSSEKSTKHERFYILKNHVNTKYPMLWKLAGDKLQKFEPVDVNGGQCFGSTSVTVKLSDFNLHKYQEVETSVVQVKPDKIIVEICDETDVPTDSKIKENFMKESRCYENQFSVYIQTLVSQALDSNFLNEIVKENDVYFLNNMKVIDDVTRTYLVDLTAVVKWGSSSVEVLVKTWPFVSMKSIKSESTASEKCAACHKSSCKKTAIFYGQPYQRDTLQGCNSNSNPNNLDKTTDLCSGCAREIILFNKIWHQKYHVFVECAKYVSKKKADDKNKSTTDMLNELLADSSWLAKLFYDIRNVWLQIWTIVQKLKGS